MRDDSYTVDVATGENTAAAASADGLLAAAKDGAAVDATTLEESPELTEANRRFVPPTPEYAAHTLRELNWGEQIVLERVAAAQGGARSFIYSLKEAWQFFTESSNAGFSLGSAGTLVWIDIDEFITWMRDVVGDTDFVDVVTRELEDQETYNEKIETLRDFLGMRMAQYTALETRIKDEAEKAEEQATETAADTAPEDEKPAACIENQTVTEK